MAKTPPITIISTTDRVRIERWCTKGLEHRIHFRDHIGLMEDWYHDYKNVDAVAIALCGRVPVGMAIVVDYYADGWTGRVNIGVYVRDNFRQLGIGAALVKKAKQRSQYYVYPSRWNYAARALYDSAGV